MTSFMIALRRGNCSELLLLDIQLQIVAARFRNGVKKEEKSAKLATDGVEVRTRWPRLHLAPLLAIIKAFVLDAGVLAALASFLFRRHTDRSGSEFLSTCCLEIAFPGFQTSEHRERNSSARIKYRNCLQIVPTIKDISSLRIPTPNSVLSV